MGHGDTYGSVHRRHQGHLQSRTRPKAPVALHRSHEPRRHGFRTGFGNESYEYGRGSQRRFCTSYKPFLQHRKRGISLSGTQTHIRHPLARITAREPLSGVFVEHRHGETDDAPLQRRSQPLSCRTGRHGILRPFQHRHSTRTSTLLSETQDRQRRTPQSLAHGIRLHHHDTAALHLRILQRHSQRRTLCAPAPCQRPAPARRARLDDRCFVCPRPHTFQ